MSPTQKGSVRLCRIAGLTVFLHWSWFAFALWHISAQNRNYTSFVWNALEYLSLLTFVFTHALMRTLACRSVGGHASYLILWPLGSLTDATPPARPGATLWTASAGSLANLVFLPIFLCLFAYGRSQGWTQLYPNLQNYLQALCFINALILLVNLLPIYPLDGGRIIQALLWFPLGRARSLYIAAAFGLILGTCLLALILWKGPILGAVLCAFLLFNCWRALGLAHNLALAGQIKRRPGFACPSCLIKPPLGRFWTCSGCQSTFDTFQTNAACPICAAEYPTTRCLDCGTVSRVTDWMKAPPVYPKI